MAVEDPSGSVRFFSEVPAGELKWSATTGPGVPVAAVDVVSTAEAVIAS